jgi:hypothetical protein
MPLEHHFAYGGPMLRGPRRFAQMPAAVRPWHPLPRSPAEKTLNSRSIDPSRRSARAQPLSIETEWMAQSGRIAYSSARRRRTSGICLRS